MEGPEFHWYCDSRIGFQHPASNSTSLRQNSTLSLVAFNLEPLTDTLQILNLRGNLLDSLPMQFRGRNFASLRSLDLSYNSLNGWPWSSLLSGAMRKVQRRKVLNLKIGLRVVLTSHCRCRASLFWTAWLGWVKLGLDRSKVKRTFRTFRQQDFYRWDFSPGAV